MRAHGRGQGSAAAARTQSSGRTHAHTHARRASVAASSRMNARTHLQLFYLERKDFARQGKVTRREAVNLRGESSVERKQGGRDESERRRAESQWIVAARPLCHLQYPVAYLSRLQRILPAARWESRFKAALAALPPRGPDRRHVPLGTGRSLLQVGNRAAGARVALARILT